MTGAVVSHYRVEELLGQGGMGVVYRAVDTRLGRTVALKFLRTEETPATQSQARFEREARAISALNHSNICTLYDVGEWNGRFYLIFEYLEGETLQDRLQRQPFSAGEVIEAGLQTADALDAAHAQGLIHRDIKPANVFLTTRGQIKLLDFGLAKIRQTEPARTFSNAVEITETMTVVSDLSRSRIIGTLPYMSPEQLRGEEADARSDLFSLGATLYEMATGRRPFSGTTSTEVSAAILEREPIAPKELRPDLPLGLSQVILTALEKDPSSRYQTAAELRTALRQKALHAPTRTRRRVFIAGAIAAVLAAAMAGVLLYQSWQARHVVRFQRMTISRVTGSGNATAAAISPDGRYVAYVAVENGKQSFRIRQLSSNSEVQVTPGAANADYRNLTFAPDGNTVYYGIGAAGLFAIPTLGGAPVLVNRNVDSPVSFSPDGKRLAFVRYYPSRLESTIFTANADGTGEHLLVSVRKPETLSATVAWSPEGRTLVTGIGGNDGRIGLAAIPAQGGSLKVFTDKHWLRVPNVSWLSHGRGLIVQGLEIPFSPVQLWYVSYPKGTYERITNDLNRYGGVSLTSDSSTIATVQLEKTSGVSVIDSEGKSEPVPVTANGSGLDGTLGLAWTPDGRIVYVSAAGGQPDLWITSQDGRDAKAFPGNQTSRTIPSVTPDGRYIFFIGGGVDHLPHIWRMALDGGRQTQLTSGATGESTAHCCLDGKWVVHNSLGPRRLWRVPIDGGPSEPILEMTGHFPAISPDSSMIAFNSVGAQGGPSQGIGVLTVRDGNVKRFPIRNVDRTEPLLLYRPLAWTADSKGFILIRETQDISNLWVYLVDGSAPYQLTHFRDGRIFYLALSGDGKRIALARGRLSSDVVLIRNVQ